MGSKNWILSIDHFKTHLFFFKFLVGGPFSAWILVRRLCQNFKALQRGHLTSVRGPISYRLRFMTRRSFFVFLFFFHQGGGVRRLVENSTLFFEPFPQPCVQCSSVLCYLPKVTQVNLVPVFTYFSQFDKLKAAHIIF